MPRLCGACVSPRLADINLALMAHESTYREIARRFNVSEDALWRHQREHLHWTWQESKELRAKMSTERLVERLDAMERLADEILADAAATHDNRLRLLVMREVRANVEALLRLGVTSELEQEVRDALAELDARSQPPDMEVGSNGYHH